MGNETDSEKQTITNAFNRAATVYDRVGPRYFVYFGSRLVELANLKSGERVLDIAAGRGAVLFPAAEKVGNTGQVVGIDLSEMMVKETGQEIRGRGLKNAEIRQMDAEHLDFSDSLFDAALCGFGIFFLPHLDQALAEFRRVLKSNGTLGVTTFGKPDERWQWYRDLTKKHQVPSYPAGQRIGLPIFNTQDGMKGTMRDAGFTDTRVVDDEIELIFKNEDEWWAFQFSAGARIRFEQMPHDALERFKLDAFQEIQASKQSDGIHQLVRVLITVATKSNG